MQQTSGYEVTPEPTDERLYTPYPGEAQLTLRAVIVGCLVGGIVSCTNIYIGLKIGWSFGASIIAAVLGLTEEAVESRLAPATPSPGPLEDCYRGLAWVHDNASKLGVDAPIIEQVYHVLHEDRGLDDAIRILTTRDRKHEFAGIL